MRGFILNQFTRQVMGLGPAPYEVFSKPSLTIPDQAISLQQIIDRYIRTGQSNVTVFDPVYLGEETVVPDLLEQMTPMERLDYAAHLKRGIAEKQLEMSERKQKRHEDALIKQALSERAKAEASGEAAPTEVVKPV